MFLIRMRINIIGCIRVIVKILLCGFCIVHIKGSLMDVHNKRSLMNVRIKGSLMNVLIFIIHYLRRITQDINCVIYIILRLINILDWNKVVMKIWRNIATDCCSQIVLILERFYWFKYILMCIDIIVMHLIKFFQTHLSLNLFFC